ncbi:uncharacterized protein LOC124888947 [Capsicum annuum]|uniref:uncharacterized protein LOC124888947 n=1 Tax=Capsicum annuum TaxID=4072 RepID=UPI001FB108B7|nr:uncharacterized protein LOC124888947 [Capsicum annuum]
MIEVELFDVWGIDFIGPFVSLYGMRYILVVVDYVPNWVESISLSDKKGKEWLRSLKGTFSLDLGCHAPLLATVDLTFETECFELPCQMNASRQDWSRKLDDALWAYRMDYKTPIGMSPYQLVYGKECDLPIKLEHKALWALIRLNLNWNKATQLRLGKLNEMDEFRLGAYERANLYREKIKKYHDRRIAKRDFQNHDWMLQFNSRLNLFIGKLKSKWSGPFQVNQVYSSRVVELANEDGSVFKVNGQRLKLYIGSMDMMKRIATIYLNEV